jgi:CIC family chloride channel protein
MKKLSDINSRYWDRTRQSLASARALPILSFLGLISGVLVGVIIVIFRLLIEMGQSSFLPDGNIENYESLMWDERILIIFVGSLLLGLVFYLVSKVPLRVGVIHVMERLAYHEGYLPLKNAIMQFFGGAIAIILGHSVGREGPSIHLGAAGASLLGQKLNLPNNSIRTLVACGTAAAIAASFNTPLAGVIFAMEVVVMEYTISGFTPVILASVSATVVNRVVFDAEPVFHVPPLELVSIWELFVIIAMGVAIGGLAALFIVSLRWITTHTEKLAIWIRYSAAGLMVGLCALFVPEVMGIGYDTVNSVLIGDFALTALVMILLFKLIATVISTGMGLPAGFISPILFMGAIAGSITGMLMALLPVDVSAPGLYAMLGMGAMMGAALQAPLAALLALLELTANENIIFPGMLAIISANLACRELFGQKSVYLSQMQGIGLDYRNDPIAQSLRRLAVSSVMNREVSFVPREVEREQARTILTDEEPHWLVIQRDEGYLLLPAADLARYLEESEEETIDLMEIPSKRQQMAPIRQQSTLQTAYNMLNDIEAEALYVIRPGSNEPDQIFGIVTRSDLEESYRLRADDSFF